MSTLNVANITDGTDTVETGYVVNGSAKAWVNFNGTGTVAIRDSLNVASITDNGTGDYTANFTDALTDADYVAVASARQLTASGYLGVVTDVSTSGSSFTRTTAVYQLQIQNVVGGLNDNPFTQVAFFR